MIDWRRSRVRLAKMAGGVRLALIGLVCLGALGGTVSLAQTGDIETIINWLDRLDKDVAGIQKRLVNQESAGVGVEAGWSPTNHETRLSELEEQLRLLTGEIEEARHEVGETVKALSALSEQLESRLAAIETGLTSVQPSGAADAFADGRIVGDGESIDVLVVSRSDLVDQDPNQGVYDSMEVLGEITSETTVNANSSEKDQIVVAGTATSEPVPVITAEESYAAAYGLLLKKRDYVSAEQALRSFLQNYPEHKLAGNAYYWLGETFYVRNNYEGAAKAFAKGYKNFPDGAKAPDNLLKLGLSFRGMGQDESACHVFRKLIENYPDAPAVIVSRVEQEQAEAACS